MENKGFAHGCTVFLTIPVSPTGRDKIVRLNAQITDTIELQSS